jgi:polar amino acid transport system permease protein
METRQNQAKNNQGNSQKWLMIFLIVVLGIIVGQGLLENLLTVAEWQTLWERLPYILWRNQDGWSIKGGFVMNIIISLICMAISTVLGILLGLAQISSLKLIRWLAFCLTQFFRNSPWLVILFVILYLFPFEIDFGFVLIKFSDTVKSIIGLSLVVSANIAEIVRGAIQSIPSGQWEASVSMGFTRWQILSLVIFPQAIQRMIPPWMNWYAILTMGTTLTGIVGVPEGLTAVREVLEFEGERFAIPCYGILMLLFFIYCYPIAVWTRQLERRFFN